MTIRRITWLAVVAICAGTLAVSCSGTVTAPSSPKTDTPAQPVVQGASLAPAAPNGVEAAYTEKVNLDTFAPRGSGRDLVIMNCDYCHPWVCTLQGRRTVDVWTTVEYTHRETLRVHLSDQDWNRLFSYLKDNFNDVKPEPQLPPAYDMVQCVHDSLY